MDVSVCEHLSLYPSRKEAAERNRGFDMSFAHRTFLFVSGGHKQNKTLHVQVGVWKPKRKERGRKKILKKEEEKKRRTKKKKKKKKKKLKEEKERRTKKKKKKKKKKKEEEEKSRLHNALQPIMKCMLGAEGLSQ